MSLLKIVKSSEIDNLIIDKTVYPTGYVIKEIRILGILIYKYIDTFKNDVSEEEESVTIVKPLHEQK